MSERFVQIEKQLKAMCAICQSKDERITRDMPECKGYPEQKCAAIYVLDNLTAPTLYANEESIKAALINQTLISDALEADFA